MQFYKIQCELPITEQTEEESVISLRSKRAEAKRIAKKSEELYRENPNCYCFLSDVEEGHLTVGFIATVPTKVNAIVADFLKRIGRKVTDTSLSEIVFGELRSLLGCAMQNDYVDDDDDVLELFSLDNVRRGLLFGENMVEVDKTEEELIDTAKRLFVDQTMEPELARIYASETVKAVGHPVHYMIETSDRDKRRESYQTLLNALYAKGRLMHRRYAYLDFCADDSYSRAAYDALYKMSFGGAVIVRYLLPSGDEEDFSPSAERETIEHLCAVAKRYRNRVLTVFCLPKGADGTKTLFCENLGNMALVQIGENLLDCEEAVRFFKKRAKEEGVRVDKALLAVLEEGEHYPCSTLEKSFSEWYDRKLRTSVYPQYKNLHAANADVTKTAPRGVAIEELQEMVGLSEAKRVIKKALDYYKMRALYEEHGIKAQTPAMHMIFTGNPGTAKTTAARLFSRIMRDNGLLSRGHLVEVGRGDLVGKYVGWTAKTVQAKFKEAVGGVLFIDEAYSLVDDHNGGYGSEAINTIVQEMENRRGELVVIFAGYPDKMEGFLKTNPGLRSRIAFHVPFADYSNTELCGIADLICKHDGMKMAEGAREKLTEVFDIARGRGDFGNGRFVRNLLEQAKMNQAERLLEKDVSTLTPDDLRTITAEDIRLPSASEFTKRTIGFY